MPRLHKEQKRSEPSVSRVSPRENVARLFTRSASWSSRQHNSHQAALTAGTIGNLQPPVMCLCNLPGENQANAAAVRFCRVKRSEYVRRIHEARSVVFDHQGYILIVGFPTHCHLLLGIATAAWGRSGSFCATCQS